MIGRMTKRLSQAYLDRFADALVREIKAEAARRGFGSSRKLGEAIGKSSQYMSDRLDGGSSKTGKRVAINVSDLSRICAVLGVDAPTLVSRAEEAAGPSEFDVSDELAARRKAVGTSEGATTVTDDDLAELPSAAEPERRDDGTSE